MCTDEEYSPDLQRWVAKQLRQADEKTLRQLLRYYRQRGGPGLALAEAEAEARRQEPVSLTPSRQ